MLILLDCFLVFCISYAIGRVSHIYGGHLNTPDHWIYGALMFLPGLFFSNIYIFLLFSFGLGFMISDFQDFLDLNFWGPDEVGVKKFWGFD